jgi:hypothetical protein
MLVVAVVAIGWFARKLYLDSAGERDVADTEVAETKELPPAPPPPPSPTQDSPAQDNPATPKPDPFEQPEAPKATPPVPSPAKPAPSAPVSRLIPVQIDSEPQGAQVSIDQGAESCKTPCPIELPAGRHVMEFSHPGYRTAQRILTSPQETSLHVRMDPLMGTLLIKSDPSDAQIFVNGQQQAKRTPTILTLPAGKYRIELRKQGFRTYEEEVEVRDQGMRTIEVSWTQGG